MMPRRRIGRRAGAAVGLFLALLGLYVLTSPGRIDMIDGQFRYEVARNWLDRGRPDIVDRTLIPIGLAIMTQNGVYAVYNAAGSVAGMPFILLARALPDSSTERERFMFSMVGPVFGAALGGLLVVAYSMLGLSLARAVLWACVCCLATLWWPGSTTIFDQNQHAFWLALALILAWESGRRRRVWPAALGGLAGAILLNYQESYALLLPAIGLAVASTSPDASRTGETQLTRTIDPGTIRRYLAFGLACGLGFVSLVAYNHARFGALTYAGRYTDPLIFGFGHPIAALFGLFLSPGKGVFLFSPPLLLALIGGRRLFARAPGLAFAIAGASIIHVLVVMQLVFFGGDWAWGPRYLLILIPMWALAMPFAAERAKRWGVTTLVALGLLSQALGVSLDHQRFFLERNLAPHFWAVDPWFYLRNSQLLARVAEVWETAREGVPGQATSFSPTPRREVTYSPLGLPPRQHGYSATWIRRFKVFYLPRPWPLWMFHLDEGQRPVEPGPLIFLCGASLALGAGVAVWSVRGEGRAALADHAEPTAHVDSEASRPSGETMRSRHAET